jgi:hypothetical protein
MDAFGTSRSARENAFARTLGSTAARRHFDFGSAFACVFFQQLKHCTRGTSPA